MNCSCIAAPAAGFRARLLVGALVAAALTGPALALTGGDILDKMNADQRGSYLAGGVEMTAFLASVQGNKERADCIMDWYYRQNGIDSIVGALTKYKDKQALPVLHVMIKRACGE